MMMNEPQLECHVCGGTDFHLDAGHYYCDVCQNQSQQVVERVFERENANNKSARRIKSEKPSAAKQDKLTSWECYNYILKGLTDEVIALGADPALKLVVKGLWMKYLVKLEVFDLDSNQAPKLSVLGPRSDMEVLMNKKRKKRHRSRSSTSTSNLSIQRQRGNTKRALIKSQYDKESQNFTQDSFNDSLSSLTNDSMSESSQIGYNKQSRKELQTVMSKNHAKAHMKDLKDELLDCHKLKKRLFKPSFYDGPNNLTSFTLYALIYLGLRIVNDKIQLCDLLRFIREGHLSFTNFQQFFKEPQAVPRHQQLYSHKFFRKRCAKLVKFLAINQYIKTPNLIELSDRFCKELNLPDILANLVANLIRKTKPKLKVTETLLPNYEGRVLSIILFVIKLLYGLDGVVEHNLEMPQCFDIVKWIQFVEFRRLYLETHHLPTTLLRRNCDCNQYLQYINNEINNNPGHIHGEVKDYLKVFENLVQVQQGDKYSPSFTPFSSYYDGDSFSDLVLDNVLYPTTSVACNTNIKVDKIMYLYKETVKKREKGHKTVIVKLGNYDHSIDSYLNDSATTMDAQVVLNNWKSAYDSRFKRNRKLLAINNSKNYQPFERYWNNLPINPQAHKIPKSQIGNVLNKLSNNFRMAVKEFARVAEHDKEEFFLEFLSTELYLTNYHYNDKCEVLLELRKALSTSTKHW